MDEEEYKAGEPEGEKKPDPAKNVHKLRAAVDQMSMMNREVVPLIVNFWNDLAQTGLPPDLCGVLVRDYYSFLLRPKMPWEVDQQQEGDSDGGDF